MPTKHIHPNAVGAVLFVNGVPILIGNEIHGYALGVKLGFATDQLDHRNWVYDFGGLKWMKKFLEEQFDHAWCIAQDDPEREFIETEMPRRGLARRVNIMPATSCEAFAEFVYNFGAPKIRAETQNRADLFDVTVSEHTGNSATFQNIEIIQDPDYFKKLRQNLS